MNWRTVATLTVTGAIGAIAFGWPFLTDPGSDLAAMGHNADASYLFVVLMALIAVVVLADITSGGLDAKTVAVLGVLAAAGAGLRLLGAGTIGFEPMFFLLVIAGRALGPMRGFLLGAMTLLASAFLTAGIGPWAPFQMMAAGWVAMGAGLLPRVGERAERWLLAGYGVVVGFAYGAIMNLWFWPFLGPSAPAGGAYLPEAGVIDNLRHYAIFYGATSLAWDIPRGILTGLVTFLSARPLLRTLRRSLRMVRFDAVGEFRPAGTTPTDATRVSA